MTIVGGNFEMDCWLGLRYQEREMMGVSRGGGGGQEDPRVKEGAL